MPGKSLQFAYRGWRGRQATAVTFFSGSLYTHIMPDHFENIRPIMVELFFRIFYEPFPAVVAAAAVWRPRQPRK
jgi:hypothetical protein